MYVGFCMYISRHFCMRCSAPLHKIKYACTDAQAKTNTRTHMPTYMLISLCISVCICVCMHTCTCMCSLSNPGMANNQDEQKDKEDHGSCMSIRSLECEVEPISVSGRWHACAESFSIVTVRVRTCRVFKDLCWFPLAFSILDLRAFQPHVAGAILHAWSSWSTTISSYIMMVSEHSLKAPSVSRVTWTGRQGPKPLNPQTLNPKLQPPNPKPLKPRSTRHCGEFAAERWLWVFGTCGVQGLAFTGV